jgi:hypothetical protein
MQSRLVTFIVAALALGCAALPTAAGAELRAAREADAFVNSVGVTVHLHYQGTVYDWGFSRIVMPKLLASGIRHVRDGAYTNPGDSGQSLYYRRCRTVAAAGIRFDLMTSLRTRWGSATDYRMLPSVYGWCGGGVESFENVNEPDVQPLPRGTDWKAATAQAQRWLWATIKGNPTTRNVSVLGPSIVWSPTAVGNLSAYLDYGNWHPYPGGQCPTCGDVYGQTVDTFLPRYRAPSGGKPMIMTETGYHNAIHAGAAGHRPVSELAAGKYVPRLLLEYFNRGFARTYLYELIDHAPDPGRTRADLNFGLLRNDGTEKPAYRAVKNLLALTRDPGPRFAPGSLNYTLSGDTRQVHQTLLQKRDGTFLLALWLERPSYDTGARPNAADDLAQRGDLVPPEQSVMLSMGTATRPAKLHHLLNDGSLSSSVATVTTGRLALNVSDRITIVELPPT